MRSLGETIRAIRKDLDLTTVQFGEQIGVDNSAVSRYERDKLNPSTKVLLMLHGLAKNRANQSRIREAIAVQVSKLSEQQAGDLLTRIERSPEAFTDIAVVHSSLRGQLEHKTKGRGRFLEEVEKLLVAGVQIHPALSDMLRIYREYGQSREIRALFRKALDYLEVEISRRPTGAGKKSV